MPFHEPGPSGQEGERKMSSGYELFHVLTEAASARMRRLVMDLDLGERVRLRNLYYPEVSADFTARGGTRTPALWDGTHLREGEEAVEQALRDLGREPSAGTAGA